MSGLGFTVSSDSSDSRYSIDNSDNDIERVLITIVYKKHFLNMNKTKPSQTNISKR